MKKIRYILLTIFLQVLFSGLPVFASSTAIVDPGKLIGPVNRLVLGNSLIGYRDGERGKFFNQQGGGVWSQTQGAPEPGYVALMKDAGVSALRWPGGKWRKSMDWKNGLVGAGPRRQAFGLPEFLRLCEEIGAQPVITLSAEYAETTDIPALIAYLNQPVEVNNKYSKWAKLRSADGRESPWGVTWFEFGNENFNGSMPVDDYIRQFKKTIKKIKVIDSSAMLGAVLEDSDSVDSGWTGTVLQHLATIADFGIIHPYYPMVTKAVFERLDMRDILNASLYADANFEYRLALYQSAAKQFGRPNPLPLAATEYTAHFKQNEPVKVRHTLATALHNADFIRVMLLPESHIELATYWHLANGYWGMLHDSTQKNGAINKQPNYYVFALYNEFLLDNLISMSFENIPTMSISGVLGVGPRGEANDRVTGTVSIDVPADWDRKLFFGVDHSVQDGKLRIEFDGEKEIDYRHAVKVVSVKPNTLYKISVRVKSEGLIHGKAGIAVEDARGWSKNFSMEKNVNVTGDQPWHWVSVNFRTLADSEKIKIMARKFRAGGKTKGTVWYGETKVEEIPGELPLAPIITGMASASSDGSKVSVILINKSLERSSTIAIELPKGYNIISGKQLVGDGPLVYIDEGKSNGYFGLENVQPSNTLMLQPHSVTAFLFQNTR